MEMNYDSVPDSKCYPMAHSAFSTITGLKHSYLCAQAVVRSGIHGVIVECGVASGAQVGMMARGINDMGQAWRFLLFDSFEGIPMGCEKDTEQPGIGAPQHDVHAPLNERLVSSGVASVSRADVESNLKTWGVEAHCMYFEGWFQNTLPQFIRDSTVFVPGIALLRLDGDMYESTMCCLQHLYPHVVPDGMVVIDDYGLTGCKAAVHDYLEANNLTPEI